MAKAQEKNLRAEIGYIASVHRRQCDLLKKVYEVERYRCRTMIDGPYPPGMPELDSIKSMGYGAKDCLDNFAEKFCLEEV